MRYFYWLIKFILFVIMFGFAMHNAEPVVLKFFLGYFWQAPLALLLLVFFVVGAVFGLLAAFSKIIRLRREVVGLKKELRARQTVADLAPDLLVEQPRDAL
ncbi:MULTISPECIES: lipopolysaccharide assembly LapA domain-containing protein [unclassified Iodobacter]|uniref:LapA family protein n=1 Tax=unclassified Iodobacter TaxID=235634 RepID=UPI0025E5A07C|nr:MULTISPECIES: lipopolysaccharide assembly protein LapA domain-containing protein [unclassified Iodobacter]MDW5415675.1 lipopolysaccharide assembly protein LapA domain-containing protein [Iodobacter sp. CM08]